MNKFKEIWTFLNFRKFVENRNYLEKEKEWKEKRNRKGRKRTKRLKKKKKKIIEK